MGNKHGDQPFLGRLQQWLEHLNGLRSIRSLCRENRQITQGGQNALAAQNTSA